MDKNFIEKANLGEAVERFNELAKYKYPRQSLKKLYEYTFVTAPQINEDGEDDENTQAPPQEDGGMGQGMQQNAPQMPQNGTPDASNQNGGMNTQMGGQMPPDASQMPQDDGMGGQPMMGGDAGMGMADDTMNNDMMGDDMIGDSEDVDNMQEPGMGEDNIETTEMEPDDEVIDVDDLTQSQEATEYKIDGVDDRLAKLFAVVQKFSDQLENQENSIMALKDEFEKRNPTPEEKLNLRSQSSYPYSETPKGYWEKKAQENPHYDIMYDNDVSPSDEQEEFKIRKSDISGLNMKDISKSLDIDPKLSDYIGF